MKYFVDYGHGGSDSGAVSNGIYEKNVNRLIGERVNIIWKDIIKKWC